MMDYIPLQPANEPDEERRFDGDPPDDYEEGRLPIPCSKCGKPTTFDSTYGDLCFRCIRATNE